MRHILHTRLYTDGYTQTGESLTYHLFPFSSTRQDCTVQVSLNLDALFPNRFIFLKADITYETAGVTSSLLQFYNLVQYVSTPAKQKAILSQGHVTVAYASQSYYLYII